MHRCEPDGADDVWELFPITDIDGVERFKWAWSEGDGALVWSVGGPGDGWPAHEEQVRGAWGREPSLGRGDVLGTADLVRGPPGVRAQLSIEVFYGPTIPAAILGWFREAFPDAEIAAPRT